MSSTHLHPPQTQYRCTHCSYSATSTVVRYPDDVPLSLYQLNHLHAHHRQDLRSAAIIHVKSVDHDLAYSGPATSFAFGAFTVTIVMLASFSSCYFASLGAFQQVRGLSWPGCPASHGVCGRVRLVWIGLWLCRNYLLYGAVDRFWYCCFLIRFFWMSNGSWSGR